MLACKALRHLINAWKGEEEEDTQKRNRKKLEEKKRSNRYLLQVIFGTGQVASMVACEYDGRATCQGLPTHGTSVLPI